MKRALLTAAAAAACLTGLAGPASGGPTLLTDAELDGERAGYETPFGFDINFGASVKTYVNGQLALQTTLTWTPTGVQTTSVPGPTWTPPAVPAAAPAGVPAGVPTGIPQGVPTGVPPGVPTGVPSGVPAGVPDGVPTGVPAGAPTGAPPFTQGTPPPTATTAVQAPANTINVQGGPITPSVPNGPANAAPFTMTTTGPTSSPLPNPFTGITVPGGTLGATQVIQDVTANHIVSMVLNTANNQTIRQDTNITIVLPQLVSLQQEFATAQVGLTLQNALNAALTEGAHH